jgi:hypothetical protein
VIEFSIKLKEDGMKKIIVFFLLAVVILIVGCSVVNNVSPDNRVTIIGSGDLVSRQIDVSGFDRIETDFAFNVTVHQGEGFSVVAVVDDNLVEYLYVEASGGTLYIGLKPGYAYDIPRATMQAQVTMPQLVGLQLSGSSHATLSGFDTIRDFSAELTGSSSLNGEIQAENANLNAYGSTFIKLSGKGKKLSVDVCGSNAVDLQEYAVKDAALQVACNSIVAVNVAGRLQADAAQYAQVYFAGKPSVRSLNVHENAFVQPR